VASAAGNWIDHLVSVIFIDLNRFKQVNDALGHAAGDQLLRLTVARMRASLRTDALLARLGGDEFVVLLHGCTEGEAVTVVDRLQAAIREPFDLDGREVLIGAAMGLVMVDEFSRHADAILQDADIAMYQAKQAGDRLRVFDTVLRHTSVERMETERGLRAAIDDGSLRVVFQPIVELSSGRTVGAETLLRWQHPERGLLLPGDFIGLAESTGLIVPIGDWVIRQAIACAALVPADVGVGVNVSAQQLARSPLLAALRPELDRAGVAPGQICLEVLENELLDEANLDRVHRLRNIGCKIAIDDFGTGYGSLLYLKRLPVDLVKIDRSFVRDLGLDRVDTAIVTRTASLARDLGITVVAEGIEHQYQLDALATAGVGRAQGFLLGAGLSMAELVARCAAQALLDPAH
jgi:diguanylate cyclase (GGDEF)-like protein